MVRSISEWRAEVLQEAELKQYEVFSYPSKIASSKYQGTWTVPKDKARPNLRIQSLFLSCDPTKLLSETTGCTVAEGINGLSLHFGACSAEQIIQAKRKMDNIMKYYVR